MEEILQKIQRYAQVIAARKKRLVLAVIISISLFTVSYHYLYEGINKRFLIIAALCIFTGALIVCPKPEWRYFDVLFIGFYLLLVPRKMFQRMELPVHDLAGMADGAEIENIAIILLIYAVLLLITQRIYIALGGGGILCLFMLLLNYYTVQSQGGSLGFVSLRTLGTALPVLNGYQPAMSGELWYSILYFCFFIALGFWYGSSGKGKTYHLAVTSLSLIYGLFFICFWNVSSHGYRGHYDTAWEAESLNGFLAGIVFRIQENEPREWEWYEKFPVVCHALGTTEDGIAGTNSMDALEYNYALGQRVFEADISIAADRVAVLRHDWDSDLGQAESFGWTEEQREIPTSTEFMQVPIYGKYRPMTLLMLYEVMNERQDMYVVIDPKYDQDVVGQFTVLVNTALDNGYESVLDRIIVQLYYEQMYDLVEEVYHFKNYLYTLYYIGYPGAEAVGTFCQANEIPVVVMPYTWMDEKTCQDLQAYSLQVYVHTVDEEEDMQRAVAQNVDGIYSDYILPRQMKKWLMLK